MNISKWFVPIVAMFLIAGCGGSGGGAATTGISEISSLSDVPTSVVDPSQYDVSTNTALQENLASKSWFKAAGDTVTFSRAGCETDRMKKNIIRNALLPKMVLCYMQAFETAAGGNAAGDGEFNLWNGSDVIPEGSGPSEVDSFSPRMAIKKSGSELTFVMCNGTEKAMEMIISTANDQYSGHVIDMWGDNFAGRLDFSADGEPDNFTTASFTQQMVEASAFWNGFGSETLEATPSYDTVYGFYNEQGDNNYAGSIYARFDATQGTARYKQETEGSYPAWTIQETYDNCEIQSPGFCGDIDADWLGADGWMASLCSLPDTLTAGDFICFSDDSDECVSGEGLCCPSVATSDTCSSPAGLDTQESFTISLTDPVNHVLDFEVATSSNYAADVAAATLQSASTQPTIAFTSASADVDCSGSDSWDVLTFTSEPDISACQAMEDEMSNWDTGELCQILDSAASGQAGVD